MYMKSIILVPDVHGRTFWKEAIPFVEDGTPCIFLGDYVDPYESEGISDLDALKNLREVLHFARTNQDRVTLLLGNHDLSYLGDPPGQWTVYANRFCYDYSDVISELLNENTDLMSLCAYREVGGRPFLFSHAGLHPVWMSWCGLFDNIKEPLDGKELSQQIEAMFRESLATDWRTDFIDALAMVGSFRGGTIPAGSLVWADVREYADILCEYTQIFGHTMQFNDERPCLMENNICIDCRQCFYLDPEGTLRYLRNDEPVK